MSPLFTFSLLLLVCLSQSGNAVELTGRITSSDVPTSSLRQTYTRKQLAAITKHFTSYYLYFGEKSDTLHNNGGLPMGMCFPEWFSNTTLRHLSHAVVSSVRAEYVNRVLTREQISWKKNEQKSKSKKTTLPSGSSETSSPEQSQNSTEPKHVDEHTTNITAQQEPTPAEEDDPNKNNKIHNHLIFVMLLPHHPYSQELRKIITTVTPMFPQATIVLGNAYEFKDMISKYYVTSFPKVLYFRSGIYLEAFEGAYSAEDMAAQFADWTYSLPQAVPLPFSHTRLALRTLSHTREVDIYAPDGHMRYGLALQPLPLTVQYTLLDFTLPAWVVQYVPWLEAKRERGNDTVAVSGGSVAVSELVVHTTTDSAITDMDTTEHTNTNIESDTSIDVTSSMDGTSSEQSLLDSQQLTNTPSTAHSDNALKSMVDATAVHTTAGAVHTDAHTTRTIPIQLRITVPMPNVEPFLGSLENYAVWDTRMFLLAGLYVIVRVLFLLRKWMSGRRE